MKHKNIYNKTDAVIIGILGIITIILGICLSLEMGFQTLTTREYLISYVGGAITIACGLIVIWASLQIWKRSNRCD